MMKNCFYTVTQGKVAFLSLIALAIGAQESLQDIKSLQVKPSNTALVAEIHSYVIIDKNAHEELWNIPLINTQAGDPIRFYLSVNISDRRGKDLSFGHRYFTSTDFFHTLENLDSLPAGIDCPWNKTIEAEVKDFPEKIYHLWSSPPVHIDRDHVIQAFTYQAQPGKYSVSTAWCRLDGGRLIAEKMGTAHTIENSRRGLYEPHVVRWQDRFYMTCRAEDGHGYLLISDDGLHWSEPTAWCWDDGEEIAMDQTMTKFVVHAQGLVLCYTRILPDNATTFRHRAPLFIAEVDAATRWLKRATEYVIVPNKGLPVGNFWVWPVNQEESCVVTAEWPRDEARALQKINGDIWFCRIQWRQPNTLMTADGREVASLFSGTDGSNK